MVGTMPRICTGLKICLIMIAALAFCRSGTESPYYQARQIFETGEYGPKCHSSTITELENGDLIAAWWSGSYEGATDVAIKAARLRRGAETWERAETVADLPDRFEGNPVLFSLPDGRLWLFFVVIQSR
jgi:predicted neuraminidase